ncbi:DUF4870 domain-containing protein [Glaciibacter superstes]|uniref:DUF4870 domain-containing protein n=1 Tax=Glaciibacter superstes TaxID=501023 RepID=UPI0009FC13D7|nr:DUF4870 domain-containing protein [Glaciibacter superstes]
MSDPNAQAPGDPNLGQQPPQQPYQPAAPAAGAPLTEAQDKQWASFAHLGGILSFLPSLIIYLVFKDRGRFTATEAKEALNFQITLVIAYVVIWFVTGLVAMVTFGIGSLIGLLVWVVWIGGVIFSILGFVQAKDGNHYRYPFSIRFIK